ncbi:MAG: hypothetical protein [Bacteriophage sp.]|nr:MAG: hypothetical protein [Bacteriophage sp.]
MFQWLSGKLVLVMGVVIALLLIGLVSISLYASNRATKVGELQGTVDTLTTSLIEAQVSLQLASDSAEVTDSVVTQNTVDKDVSENKTLINIAKVDSLATKRTYDEITDSELRTALSDSMWDAYCAATDKDDSACASLKSSTSVQSKPATRGR